MWYPHTRSASVLNNKRSIVLLFTPLPISCPMMAWCRAICRRPIESRARVLWMPPATFNARRCASFKDQRSARKGQPPIKPNISLARAPCLYLWARGKRTKCTRHASNPRCRRSVDGRAQHTRRILVQLCKHDVENLLSSSLLACRYTTRTEICVEACTICTCTNFGPQNMDRKSNMCARINWGVMIDVSMSLNNAPWCVVHKS
jgi:hypothetical protein